MGTTGWVIVIIVAAVIVVVAVTLINRSRSARQLELRREQAAGYRRNAEQEQMRADQLAAGAEHRQTAADEAWRQAEDIDPDTESEPPRPPAQSPTGEPRRG